MTTPNNDAPNGKPTCGPDSNFKGKKGRSGPAKGNANALRHGLRAGKLPDGCGYIEKRINSFRRQIEAIVLEQKGEITLTDAAAINSACKWERHGLLALNWLRKEGDKLSLPDRLRFSAEIAKASDRRDAAIRALALDAREDDPPWVLPAPQTAECDDDEQQAPTE